LPFLIHPFLCAKIPLLQIAFIFYILFQKLFFFFFFFFPGHTPINDVCHNSIGLQIPPREEKKVGSKSRRAAAADDLDEGEEAPNLFLQNWRCRKELPIEHFLRLRPLSTNTSAKKHTHTEVLEFKLVKIRQAKHPEVMLERLFDHLLRRLTQGAAELNGQPRLIGLQIANKHMTSPFFVPLRTPAENTAETIAAALVLLNRQSGGRLKLFKTKMICKLSGVWPVGEKG
jgi:hypothetical protein